MQDCCMKVISKMAKEYVQFYFQQPADILTFEVNPKESQLYPKVLITEEEAE